MNEVIHMLKKLRFFHSLAIVAVTILLSACSKPTDASQIVVSEVTRTNFKVYRNYVSWLPNQPSVLVQGDSVERLTAYDVSTGQEEELFTLSGIDMQAAFGYRLHLSASGDEALVDLQICSPDNKEKCVVNGLVGLIDLATHSGYMLPPIPTGSDHVAGVAFSPDGKTAVLQDFQGEVSGTVYQSTSAFYLYDVETSTYSALEFVPKDAFGIVLGWTPDGKWIVVNEALATVPEGARGAGAISMIRPDLSERVTLVSGTKRVDALTFSPDGNYMVWMEAEEGWWNYTFYIANRDGSSAHQLELPISEPLLIKSNIAWSPDGKYLAVAAGTKEDSLPFIYLFSIKAGD